jgi:hypothetical protein
MNARPVAGKRQIGDLLRGGGEPWRQDKIPTISEELLVPTVLVHDRQALHPLRRRPRFRDIDDARIEITVLAGEARVDGVGDPVRDAPPVGGRRRERQTGHLLLSHHVPQSELDAQPPVCLLLHTTRDERLGIDHAPVAEARHGLQRLRRLDERPLVDWREQARAREIVGDDVGDLRTDFGAVEIRHRDRQWPGMAVGDVDPQLGLRVLGERQDAGRNHDDSAQREDGFHAFAFPLIRSNWPVGTMFPFITVATFHGRGIRASWSSKLGTAGWAASSAGCS